MGSPTITDLLGILNVKDFGLTALATADNSGAINRAIEAAHAAGGGTVTLPADVRTVGISASISLHDDVELVIPAGVTIKLLAGSNVDMVKAATGASARLRVSGAGTIDGNRAGNTSGTWYGINLAGIADAVIAGVTVKSCRTGGILLDGCTRAKLSGVTVTDCGTHGIALSDSVRCILEGCRSYDNSKVASSGVGDGISLAGTSTDNLVVGAVCYDSSADTKRQGYGVREAAASSCDRNVITGGSLGGNLTGTVSLVGGSSKLADDAAVIATSGTPSAQALGDAAALGTSNQAAPLDHKHAMAEVARPTAPCEGRLTLASGTPVPTADQGAKSALYYTPYIGNKIALYDGSKWQLFTFAELSLSLAGLPNQYNYDIFIYDNAGTLTLQSWAWTNNNTRATALAYQDGVLVKGDAPTRRYLGTIRTTTVDGQCEDSYKARFVWNYYNRVVKLMAAANSAVHTYTDNANWRAWNNNTTQGEGRADFVIGVQEDTIRAALTADISCDPTEGGMLGLGLLTTTGNDSPMDLEVYNATGQFKGMASHLVKMLAAGFNWVQVVEKGNNPSAVLAEIYMVAEVRG